MFRHLLLQIGDATIAVVCTMAMRRCVEDCNLLRFHTDIHRLCIKARTTSQAYHGSPGIEISDE